MQPWSGTTKHSEQASRRMQTGSEAGALQTGRNEAGDCKI